MTYPVQRWLTFLLWAGALLLLLPVLVWFWTSLQTLAPEDSAEALRPSASSGNVARVSIADSAQWKRIRKYWGDPEFVITIPSSETRSIRVIRLRDAVVLDVKPGHPAYGYHPNLSALSFRIEASLIRPGDVLEITSPQPFVTAFDWPHVKDSLVGQALTRETRPWALAGAGLSALLALCAAWLGRFGSSSEAP